MGVNGALVRRPAHTGVLSQRLEVLVLFCSSLYTFYHGDWNSGHHVDLKARDFVRRILTDSSAQHICDEELRTLDILELTIITMKPHLQVLQALRSLTQRFAEDVLQWFLVILYVHPASICVLVESLKANHNCEEFLFNLRPLPLSFRQGL